MAGILDSITEHARDDLPYEACGLVVRAGSRVTTIRARNLSPQPLHHVSLDPEAWVVAADVGEVIGTYHSHPNGSAEPSLTDLQGCEASGMPMYILGYPSGDFREVQPSGYLAPYEGRPYLYGVHDCFTLVQEWQKREKGIHIPTVETVDGWWNRGENHIMDNYTHSGFVQVAGEPKWGDILVFTVGGTHSHLGVYLGNNLFLHQPRSRVSSTSVYGQHWRACTHATLRHQNG